ncbi:MAG: hypothetical protein V3R64_07825 [Sphingomonadales bacterium]
MINDNEELEPLDDYDIDILARVNNLENLVVNMLSAGLEQETREEAEAVLEDMIDGVKSRYKQDPRMKGGENPEFFKTVQERAIGNIEGLVWRIRQSLEEYWKKK